MLDQIILVLLTYNNVEQNISRTLSPPAVAKDIVVVYSGSTDGTVAALAHNVRVCRFDTHASKALNATTRLFFAEQGAGD